MMHILFPSPIVFRGAIAFTAVSAMQTDQGTQAEIHAINGEMRGTATLLLSSGAEREIVGASLAAAVFLTAAEGVSALLELLPPIQAQLRDVAATGGQESWEEPIPFSSVPVNLPPFPLDIFPPWLRSYTEALAESTQTPPDLAGMLALPMLATGCQRLAYLRVQHDHEESLCLYTLIAMASGERKSSVYKSMSAPIYEYEKTLQAKFSVDIAHLAATRKTCETGLSRAIVDASKPNATDDDRDRVRNLTRQLDGLATIAPTVLVIQDSTPEAMVKEMSEQGGMLAAMDAEGGLLDSLTGRYNDAGPNLDPLLKAHSMDTIRSARISRGRITIERPMLTLGIAPQPDVLVRLGAKSGARKRGLLARFIYSLPQSRKGRRSVSAPPVPGDVVLAYARRMLRILAASEPRYAGEKVEHSVMTLSPDALRLWVDFTAWLEPQLAEGFVLGSTDGWGEKLCGCVARISALLHVADGDHPLDQVAAPVSASAMARAIRLGATYLLPHAMAALRLMGSDLAHADALKIEAWLARKNKDTFTESELFRDMHVQFGTLDGIRPGIGVLLRYHHIRPVNRDRPGPGRKPSPTYAVVAPRAPTIVHPDPDAIQGTYALPPMPADAAPAPAQDRPNPGSDWDTF